MARLLRRAGGERHNQQHEDRDQTNAGHQRSLIALFGLDESGSLGEFY